MKRGQDINIYIHGHCDSMKESAKGRFFKNIYTGHGLLIIINFCEESCIREILNLLLCADCITNIQIIPKSYFCGTFYWW